jgi:hypothetical protein
MNEEDGLQGVRKSNGMEEVKKKGETKRVQVVSICTADAQEVFSLVRKLCRSLGRKMVKPGFA